MDALCYALIAQEAYFASPDIGIENSASRAIIRQTDDGLCIAFPGTDNLASFAADFDIAPFDVAGIGKVYKGFWDAWDAIALPVVAASAGQSVTFSGHSLGAAIALMCAAYLTVGGNPPKAVYGFEPPKVGIDSGIQRVLQKVPLHLFKNGNDAVPDVPPGGIHAGPLIPIGKPAFPFPNLTDHEISRVIAALQTSSASSSS